MKKIGLALAALSLFSLSACGGKSDNDYTSPYQPGNYATTYPPQGQQPAQGQQINTQGHTPKNISKEAAAQANLYAEVDGLKSQVQAMKAEIEDLGFRLQRIEEKTGAEGNTLPKLSNRVSKLEDGVNRIASQLAINLDSEASQAQAQPQGEAAHVQAPAAPAKPQAPAQPAGDPAETLYNKAYQSFQQKQYDQAIATWAEFAKGYPKHNLLPNAYFWQGEAYFQKNDYARAVLSYQEVIDKFPKSPKLPAAMLKQGYAFKKLGKDPAAKLVFQDLVKKYPDSPEAKRAKDLLAGKN